MVLPAAKTGQVPWGTQTGGGSRESWLSRPPGVILSLPGKAYRNGAPAVYSGPGAPHPGLTRHMGPSPSIHPPEQVDLAVRSQVGL